MTKTTLAKDDEAHAQECHQRWAARRNRRIEDEASYQEEWFSQQCGICRYWIPVCGQLGTDYGVCSNAVSVFDGLVRFEHDGCEHHEAADEWILPCD